MLFDQHLTNYRIEDVVINTSKRSRVDLLNEFIEFTKSADEVLYEDKLLQLSKGRDTLSIYSGKNNELIVTLPSTEVFTMKFFDDNSLNAYQLAVITRDLTPIHKMK